MFNTGAIVPLHWEWYFREKYFLTGMGQGFKRHFKMAHWRVVTLFFRDSAFHLSSWRVQGSALPQQDVVWLSQQGHSAVTKPHLWWDAEELSGTQLGREDQSLVLDSVRLVVFVSAGRSGELLYCVFMVLRLLLCLALTVRCQD